MRGRLIRRATVAVFLTLLALAVLATQDIVAAQQGPAKVIDGDTIEVAGTRVRLWGIDAPESRQTCAEAEIVHACGQLATRHLRALVATGEVRCEARTWDRYGRTVALCRVGAVDLSAAMARDGWAMAFVRYSGDYITQEREAREAGRGLWAWHFTPPWDWRSGQRNP